MKLHLWRRLTGRMGPNCERCGKPTLKPFLYQTPHTHWRCEPCEQEITNLTLRASHVQSIRELDVDVDARLGEIFRLLGPPPEEPAPLTPTQSAGLGHPPTVTE